TLAKADLMRRAMGKKDKALMSAMKKEFVDGAKALQTSTKLASDIFDLIEKFASYGFNKSHSVAYSVIAYQTAYLKAHYPAEFMAANLSSEIGNTDKIVKLIDDCRKMGIEVLPPDVNESSTDFDVVGGRIRFGLCAIKNVGESAIATVIRARDTKGKFENLYDFCRRVDLRLVNKKCLESLVQAGAFDTMDANRAQFMENLERAASFGQAAQARELDGQSSLFDMGGTAEAARIHYPSMAAAAPWPEAEKLAREKSVLGFFVSGHPLMKFEQEIKEFANVKFGDLSSFRPNATVRACGIVTAVKKKIDKRNNTMAFVGLEDFTGKAECIVFSDPFAKYQGVLQPDAMVMVVGKGEVNGEALKIIVNEVFPMDVVRERFTKSIILSIDVNDVKENTIVRLRKIMEEHKGSCPCYFSVRDTHSTTMFHTRRFSVDASGGFVEEIRQTLGPNSVRFTTQ
ncbi:MAG TPA: OB-fold nucleic acid binding domain-containing protein, partial [Bacteroidota bacterium]|nr:OB-fold nucleic acid binding domain-containing protein [Bacteroidota bacterium]